MAEFGDGNADLANFSARAWIIGVVTGLGWKIERNRQAGLALGQVGSVELVRGARS
jgi:hypothetical protein